ncbi:MAG TPA: hypothetical protein VFM35_03335 [Candidatus Binatia bacterium]|nr:hypothetical protein [Candidatus Binatia bacterium]
MKRMGSILPILVLIGSVGVSAAKAADGTLLKEEIQVKDYNGIPYVSGGFGVEERESLRAMTKGDNLELSFALQNGSYLGGAKVLIRDDQGRKILETVSDGPLFFTKLRPGKYTIDATAMGKTLEQVAQVPPKGQMHVSFAWKESEQASTTF